MGKVFRNCQSYSFTMAFKYPGVIMAKSAVFHRSFWMNNTGIEYIEFPLSLENKGSPHFVLVESAGPLRSMKNMTSEFPVYKIPAYAPRDRFFISIISMVISLCAAY